MQDIMFFDVTVAGLCSLWAELSWLFTTFNVLLVPVAYLLKRCENNIYLLHRLLMPARSFKHIYIFFFHNFCMIYVFSISPAPSIFNSYFHMLILAFALIFSYIILIFCFFFIISSLRGEAYVELQKVLNAFFSRLGCRRKLI